MVLQIKSKQMFHHMKPEKRTCHCKACYDHKARRTSFQVTDLTPNKIDSKGVKNSALHTISLQKKAVGFGHSNKWNGLRLNDITWVFGPQTAVAAQEWQEGSPRKKRSSLPGSRGSPRKKDLPASPVGTGALPDNPYFRKLA